MILNYSIGVPDFHPQSLNPGIVPDQDLVEVWIETSPDTACQTKYWSGHIQDEGNNLELKNSL